MESTEINAPCKMEKSCANNFGQCVPFTPFYKIATLNYLVFAIEILHMTYLHLHLTFHAFHIIILARTIIARIWFHAKKICKFFIFIAITIYIYIRSWRINYLPITVHTLLEIKLAVYTIEPQQFELRCSLFYPYVSIIIF